MKTLGALIFLPFVCTTALAIEQDEFHVGAADCLVFNPQPRAEERMTWSGGCKDGFAAGKGVLQWYHREQPVSRFEGTMEKGRPHGAGTYAYSSNARYEGEFRDGKRHGKGVLTTPDGHTIAGNFHGDEPTGTVELTVPKTYRYQGSLQSLLPAGTGKIRYEDGTVYEGQFKDGKHDGTGTATFANGSRYEGEWKQGKYHGKGTIVRADGRRSEGRFDNGMRIDTVYETSVHQSAARFLRSSTAIKDYVEQYDLAPDHKAFAQSPLSAWGWASGFPTPAAATEAALARCNARVQQDEPPCLVFEVDGEPVKEAGAEEYALATRFASQYLDTLLKAIDPLDRARLDGTGIRLDRLVKPPKKIGEQAAAAYNEGARALKEDKLADAEESFRKAVKFAPGIHETHLALAITLLKMGRYPEADAAVRQALWLDRSNRSAWTSAALIFARMGSATTAQAALLAAYEYTADNDRPALLEQFRASSDYEVDAGFRDIYKAVLPRLDARAAAERAARKPGATGEDKPASATALPSLPSSAFSTCARPTYPYSAQRNNQQGAVTLAFLIGESGNVLDSVVTRSSGFQVLDLEARNALSLCQFTFPVRSDAAKQMWTMVEYVWRLE